MVPVAQETTANTVRLPYSFSRRFSLGGANGLPARDDLAARRGGSRRCGAGFHGAVCFYAP